MTCSTIRRKMSSFRDHQLPEDETAALSRHVAECPGCRAELEKLTRLAAELDLLEDVDTRPYFMARLKRRMTGRRARSLGPGWLPGKVWRAAIPVAAAALVLLSALAGSRLGKELHGWRATTGAASSPRLSAGSVIFDEPATDPLGPLTYESNAGGYRE